KASTRTIPIVFQVGIDPADIGLVPSLNRPGGNLTGVTNLNAEVGPKRLELLRELLPTAQVMVLLVNPTSPTIAETLSRELQPAAPILGLQLHRLQASNEREIDDAFASLIQLRANALVIAPDVYFNTRIEQLAGSHTATSASTPAAFSRVRSRPTCQSIKPRRSSSLSISRPPRRLASKCR